MKDLQGWRRSSRATMERGAWCITRYMVADVARYMVWEKREGVEMIRRGIFDSFEAARDWCDGGETA